MASGGKRVGAGRKPADGAVLTATLNVRVDEVSLELIDEYGGGGKGVRAICHELLRYRNSGTALKSITKTARGPGTDRAILKKPVRAVVPDRAPDGRKYGMTKMLQLEAEADAAYALALKRWESLQ